MLVVWQGGSVGNSTLIISDAVTWENATYSWPCANAGMCKSTATWPTDWPWEWLIVITKASCMGNCQHFRWIVKSTPHMDGESVICGIKVILPSQSPPNSLIWSTQFDMCITVALVPLQSPCLLSRLQRRIIGYLSLRSRLARGNLEAFSEWRNSTGTWFALCCIPGSTTWVSALMYVRARPGKSCRMCAFNFCTSSLRGARRTLS